ncbi:fas-associated death domain protein [Chrysoperla carnea]|uniref:fas-associated death domain protein n=1 Tax=Chrysoperla carnea TaxID=189513 RepID=UPI001D090197|nr:fas-associated death domain protein [Chrysoperla carnea]
MFLSYDRLKLDFITMCSQYINNINFFELKKFYEKDLNSVRRLSYCDKLEDLINLLEKADILTKENVAPLRQIALRIGEQSLIEVLNYIHFYENQQYREHRHFPARTNTCLNYSQSNQINHEPPTVSNGTQQMPPVRPSAPEYMPSIQINVPQDHTHMAPNDLPTSRPNTQYDDVVRDKCFKHISERLGNKWKIVGRYLGLREGTMDVIYRKHRNDMPTQILEMLHTFEEDPMYERRKLRTNLTHALRKAKREDLIIAVAHFFDSYP